jgi:hypothetical protein
VNALHFQKLLGGEPKPAELTTQEKLLTEIRDLLKNQQARADAQAPSDKSPADEKKPDMM